MLYRLLTFCIFAAVIIALGEWDSKNRRFGFSESVNDWWLEFCIGNSRDKINDPAVTFVAIGDDFEPVLDGDDLSRLDYVVLLANLEHFKPRAVAVAPVIAFAEANVLNQGALKKQVLKMPKLTLGSTAEAGSPPAGDREKPVYPVIEAVEGDTAKIPEISRSIARPDEEPTANGVAAFTSIELSDSGDTPDHHIPMLGRVGDQVVASFALHALMADANLALEDVKIMLPPASGEENSGMIHIGDRYHIPVDSGGHLASYPNNGVTKAFYPRVNAKNLPLATADDPEIAARRAELGDDFESLGKNLIVVGETGSSAPTVSLPGGEEYAAQELIARAVAVVQSGRYIELWPEWAKWAGIALIVLLSLFLFRLQRLPLLFWGFVTGFLYVFGICLGCFKEWLVWTPPLVPLALFAGILLVGAILPAPGAATSAAGSSDKDENKDAADSNTHAEPAKA